ncbi:hypothetical protein OAA23_00865 [bacterium]|nr:hypothetical protein [bacterium]
MDKIVIAMKISQVKEILNSVFEEDEALKYALATNIAKYGRPQSKPSDKPAKLTKGLEKKREKAVKDLKKVMDEQESSFPGPDFNNKGYIAARDLIDRLRATVFRKLNDDELEEFRKTIADAFDFDLKEGLNEDEGTLNKIADMLSRKFDDLRFDVNTMADRIDVRGSQQDLFNFGTELHGEKIFDYEVFHIDDDDRGEIVRIVKSDSIMRGGVNEKKDKPDRCLRIARRKIPQSSAYRSGLIVKCRKGMIWKKEK